MEGNGSLDAARDLLIPTSYPKYQGRDASNGRSRSSFILSVSRLASLRTRSVSSSIVNGPPFVDACPSSKTKSSSALFLCSRSRARLRLKIHFAPNLGALWPVASRIIGVDTLRFRSASQTAAVIPANRSNSSISLRRWLLFSNTTADVISRRNFAVSLAISYGREVSFDLSYKLLETWRLTKRQTKIGQNRNFNVNDTMDTRPVRSYSLKAE
jgi:hypothetical protein